MLCPATCAASAAAKGDALASVCAFAPPLPPTEAAPFVESTWSDSQDAPLATETTAPMTPAMAMSGNMHRLP